MVSAARAKEGEGGGGGGTVRGALWETLQSTRPLAG